MLPKLTMISWLLLLSYSVSISVSSSSMTPTSSPTPPLNSTSFYHDSNNTTFAGNGTYGMDISNNNYNPRVGVVSFHVAGFNYDFAKRTVTETEDFLSKGERVANQIRHAYEAELCSVEDTTTAKQFLFLQMSSSPWLGGVLVKLTEGQSFGYLRKDSALLFFQYKVGECANSTGWSHFSSTSTNSGYSPMCQIEYSTDATGTPVSIVRQVTVGVETSTLQTSTFSKTSPLQMLDAGVMYTVPLHNKSSSSIGSASAILFAVGLNEYLLTNFANNTDGMTVFITNTDDEVMGASVSDVAHTIDDFGLVSLVRLANCTNELIRTAGEIVNNLPSKYHLDQSLVISHNLIIQQPAIYRTGLQWQIISVLRGHPIHDYPSTRTNPFVIVATVCLVLFVCTCTLAFVIFHFRNRLRLWRYAQPEWLLMMLVANVLCLVFACTLMTSPSVTNCKVQSWARSIALTAICTSTLAKVEVMGHGAMTHELKTSSTVKRKLAVLAAFIVAQIVLIALQNHMTENSTHVGESFANNSGDLVTRKMCKHNTVTLGIAIDTLICVLAVIAMCLSWTARNLSVLCEESRGLVVVAVEAAVLCAALISIDWTTPTSAMSLDLRWLECLLLVWYVVSMTVFVFAPRLFRQYQGRDFKVYELREMIQNNRQQQQQQQQQHKQHCGNHCKTSGSAAVSAQVSFPHNGFPPKNT